MRWGEKTSLTRRAQKDVHQVLIEDEGGRPLGELPAPEHLGGQPCQVRFTVLSKPILSFASLLLSPKCKYPLSTLR